MKLTIEVSPTKFLDTHLFNQNGTYITQAHGKETKTSTHSSSCIPKRYKRNSITTDLHHGKRIAIDFNKEVKIIRNKFIKADYPRAFINNVIKQFNYTMKSLKKMNHLYHLTFLKLKSLFIFYIYHIVKGMRPNLRTSLKSSMSLPKRISELQLVGKQEKLVLCFH